MATSIKLEEGLKNSIQNLANLRNCSPHWIMRQAINDDVEREEKMAPCDTPFLKFLSRLSISIISLSAPV